MKIKTCLLFALCTFTSLHISAQYTEVRNMVYAEAMGNGLWYSVNYERIVYGHEDLLITARAGYSFQKYRYVQNKYYTSCFPFEITMPLRLKNEHMLEVGMGCSPFFFRKEITDTMGNATAMSGGGFRAFYCGRFGYRYQPNESGKWAFRLAVTPLFSNTENPDFGIQRLWFGIGAGYCF